MDPHILVRTSASVSFLDSLLSTASLGLGGLGFGGGGGGGLGAFWVLGWTFELELGSRISSFCLMRLIPWADSLVRSWGFCAWVFPVSGWVAGGPHW